jgi:MFS family permease
VPSGPSLEESEDALLEGDRPFEPGTARAALTHPTFRRVFFGAFASNIGSWMQNVVLGAYAYELTKSSVFVGVVTLAQLGPSLLLAFIGGLVADVVDRRRLLIAVSLEQLAFSLVLALLVSTEDPSRLAIIGAVLAIGIGQSLYAPAYSALLPALVPREDLAGAISLNSAQMNGSRVIGPAIGGVLFAAFGPGWVFALNAVTYLFVIGALMSVHLPPVQRDTDGPRGLRKALVGIEVARRDRVVGRALVTVALFSFFCLPFVGQMPVIAAENLGLDPRSGTYGAFYACFGLGAVVGALSIGTVFAKRDRAVMVRRGLLGFAASMALFALLRGPKFAYPVVAILGFAYFLTITSLSTALQERLDDRVRGRVMALWIMGFGGTVPLGVMAAGPVIDAMSASTVLAISVVGALLLAWFADVRAPEGQPAVAPSPAG